MITFKTNGKKECTEVRCEVDFGTKVPSERCLFRFTWETNDPHYAYLLAIHLEEKFTHLVRKAHRIAYEIGYKDGKNKQRKKTDFSGYLNNDSPAY